MEPELGPLPDEAFGGVGELLVVGTRGSVDPARFAARCVLAGAETAFCAWSFWPLVFSSSLQGVLWLCGGGSGGGAVWLWPLVQELLLRSGSVWCSMEEIVGVGFNLWLLVRGGPLRWLLRPAVAARGASFWRPGLLVVGLGAAVSAGRLVVRRRWCWPCAFIALGLVAWRRAVLRPTTCVEVLSSPGSVVRRLRR